MLALACGGLLPRPVNAQERGIYLDVSYQRSQPPADVQAEPGNYLSGAVSVRGGSPRLYGQARGALGLGLGSGSPRWGELSGVGGAEFRASQGLAAGLAVAPFLLAYAGSDGYRAWAAMIQPFVSVTTGGIGALLHGRAWYGRSSFELPAARTGFGESSGSRAERDLRLTEASLDAWRYAGSSVTIGAAGEIAFLDSDRHWGLRTWLRGQPSNRTEMTGSLLFRKSPARTEAGFLITASYELDPNLRLQAAVTRTLTDLLLEAPQTFSAAVGLQLRLAPRSASAPLIAYVSPPALVELGALETSARPERPVRFSLRAQADSVLLMGDFTGWAPRVMRRDAERGWTLEFRIPPGTYWFAFLVDGDWYVPEGPAAVADGWGRRNLILVVPGE